jgi:membrane-associated protease RseP (regulator of RpoE activity)
VAGLRAGDQVVSFNGTRVSDWAGLTKAIDKAKPGQTVDVVVRRPGDPRLVTLPIRLADVDGQPFLGMSAKVVGGGYDRTGPLRAAVFAGRAVGRTVAGVGDAAADLPSAIPKLFSPERESTPGGQVGSVVGATDVSGQIFASDIASTRDKIALFLSLVISVNIFLGALNVLPLLPLDGGHLAVVGYERARAAVNRIRGRPDPGTVDMTRLLPVTYLAILLLVGLGVLLILADVLNPLQIPE